MIMFRHQVLIVRSSQYIQFHKFEYDEREEMEVWKQYHSIESRGFISGSKKNNKFSVIEDQYIYFFEIEEETFMPKLNNVMLNFLRCGMILIGEKSINVIAFK